MTATKIVAPRPGPLALDRGVATELVVRCAIEDVIGRVRRFGDLPDDGAVSVGRGEGELSIQDHIWTLEEIVGLLD